MLLYIHAYMYIRVYVYIDICVHTIIVYEHWASWASKLVAAMPSLGGSVDEQACRAIRTTSQGRVSAEDCDKGEKVEDLERAGRVVASKCKQVCTWAQV